jgi:hypothetical protein
MEKAGSQRTSPDIAARMWRRHARRACRSDKAVTIQDPAYRQQREHAWISAMKSKFLDLFADYRFFIHDNEQLTVAGLISTRRWHQQPTRVSYIEPHEERQAR